MALCWAAAGVIVIIWLQRGTGPYSSQAGVTSSVCHLKIIVVWVGSSI